MTPKYTQLLERYADLCSMNNIKERQKVYAKALLSPKREAPKVSDLAYNVFLLSCRLVSISKPANLS